MGKRIPTTPFSGGRPLPGYEHYLDEGSLKQPVVQPQSLPGRVRDAAREIGERVELEVRHHATERLALLVGGVCFALGVVFGRRWLRVTLVAAGGAALLRYFERERGSDLRKLRRQ